MRTKHIFVAALDVGDLLPFGVRKTNSLPESMKEQDRAKKELAKFIDVLEKVQGQKIFYMGMDIIEAKTYERFIFEKNGFFEIMTESPLAMNAHFTDQKAAEKFCKALRSTLAKLLNKGPVAEMFIESINVASEQDQSLTYEKWDTMKSIRPK